MSRSLIRAAVLAAGALFLLAAVDGVGQRLLPGAWAGEYEGHARPARKARRHARSRSPRAYALEQGSTPEEIARYFQLYGGFIDPAINKQTQGGPFDSGFFFDSGINANGGDSPYMN
jgi:hypothetical protein